MREQSLTNKHSDNTHLDLPKSDMTKSHASPKPGALASKPRQTRVSLHLHGQGGRARRGSTIARLATLVLAIGLGSAVPSVAHAEDPESLAASMYRIGERAVAAGHYADAIASWTLAYEKLGEAKSNANTRRARSIIASNIAILQMGSYDRGLPPGDLESARKLLELFIKRYAPSLGPNAEYEPDIRRVRTRLREVESRMSGETPSSIDQEFEMVSSEGPSSGGRRRLGGGGGRLIRSYPWSKFDSPFILFELNWDFGALPLRDSISGVPDDEVTVKRKNGFNINLDYWLLPRFMPQIGYARHKWTRENNIGEVTMNSVYAGFSTDLLGIRPRWAIHPMLLPYAHLGYTWGTNATQRFDPVTMALSAGEQPFRGLEARLGGHAAVMVVVKEKLIIMVRGGVTKPFYLMSEDGKATSLDNSFPKTLRGEVGLAIGFAGK